MQDDKGSVGLLVLFCKSKTVVRAVGLWEEYREDPRTPQKQGSQKERSSEFRDLVVCLTVTRQSSVGCNG